MQFVNALQGESLIVAQLSWGSSPENWGKTKESIKKRLEEKIDPIKGRLLREFLISSTIGSVIKDSLKGAFPTFTKILS